MEQKQDLDKNAIIGLVLIVLIVLGFVYMNQPSQEEVALKKHIQDSTELASKKEIKQQIVTPVVDSASIHVADSITLGSLSKLSIGESKTVTIENYGAKELCKDTNFNFNGNSLEKFSINIIENIN